MWLPAPRLLCTVLIAFFSFGTLPSLGQLPLTLTISGSQTVTEGDPIIFHETLKNVSNHPIATRLGLQYTISIRNENGKEVSPKPGDYTWVGNVSPGIIQPGQTIEDHPVTLGEEYELKPGRYVIRFIRPLDDNYPKSSILQSNEITITVIAPKKDGQQ